jgi:hypothetical protein
MPASTIALRVEGDNAEVVRHREDLARKVLDYFDQHSILPDWRVICLLDDTDFQELKLRAGEANRGIHLCLENAALPSLIPQRFWDTLRPFDRATMKCLSVFDSAVYLHGSTCEADIGLTLSLAHELRHSFQYSTEPQICAANKMLRYLPEPCGQNFAVWWDLPIEKDARVVAKTAAEAIFGPLAVENFLRARAESAITVEDGKDWLFVLSIDTSASYSFISETLRFVRAHASELKQIQEKPEWQNRPDFQKLNFAPDYWSDRS